MIAESPGIYCANAGQKLTSASGTNYVCNGTNGSTGAPGAPGAPGEPWTAGGTLPPGASEKGNWAVTGGSEDSFGLIAPISFGIPLAAELEAEHAVYVSIEENPDPTHCPGSRTEPAATSGYLCAYQGLKTGSISFSSFVFNSTVGVNMRFLVPMKKITAVIDGRIDSVNGGIRNTFEAVPDAPVESFTLTLAGGNKGLLVNSRDICASPGKATAKFIGQNGARTTLHPALKSACSKAKKKKAKRHQPQRPHLG